MAETSNGTTEKLCTKCGERPANKGHDWCSQCKTEKQARYAMDRDRMMQAKGWECGAAAMRSALLDAMKAAHPLGLLNVIEIRRWIAETPAPKSAPLEAAARSPSISSA
jgi:hypothetical protein